MEHTASPAQFALEGLFDFLDRGVSPFHAAAAACEILERAGYTLCPEGRPWRLEAGRRYYPTRNGTPVAARSCSSASRSESGSSPVTAR